MRNWPKLDPLSTGNFCTTLEDRRPHCDVCGEPATGGDTLCDVCRKAVSDALDQSAKGRNDLVG